MTWRKRPNRPPRRAPRAWDGTAPNREGFKFAVPKEPRGSYTWDKLKASRWAPGWFPREIVYRGGLKVRALSRQPHILPDSLLSSRRWRRIPGFPQYDICLEEGWVQNKFFVRHLTTIYVIEATGERCVYLDQGGFKGHKLVRLADIHAHIKLGPCPPGHAVRFRDFNPENWKDINNLDYVPETENRGIIPKQLRKRYNTVLGRKDLMQLAVSHPEASKYYRQSALTPAQESDIKALYEAGLMTAEQASEAYRMSLAVINKLLDIEAEEKEPKPKRTGKKRSMTEANLWQLVKNSLNMVEWTRVESAVTTGIPDTFGAMPGGHTFWIELKLVDEKSNQVYIRPSQKSWFERHKQVQLMRFILVRRGNWLYLFHGDDIMWLDKYGINNTWTVWKGKKPWDWDWLLHHLMDEEEFRMWNNPEEMRHRKKAWKNDRLQGQLIAENKSKGLTKKDKNKWWEQGKRLEK